ncbi:hypothetical protein [Arcanobacterium haemolyticum]
MQYEKQVTRQDIQNIKDRLAKYQLKILHEDGLYRHLYCSWPDDPYGQGNCSFHVITAPNTVTIYGDWFNAFTLKRNEDMLKDFCNSKYADIDYWAEKLQLSNKREVIRSVSEEKFFEEVERYFNEVYFDDPELVEDFMEQIRDHIQFDEYYGHPQIQLQEMILEDGYDGSYSTGDELFSGQSFGEQYTHEWVRVCLALQWAANTYCAQKDGQR